MANPEGFDVMLASARETMTRYVQHDEARTTESVRMQAVFTAIAARIEAERTKFDRYMNLRFHEREEFLKLMDGMLQTAIRNGDVELSKLAFDTMMKLRDKDPMAGFRV